MKAYLREIGMALLVLGILAWAPDFYQREALERAIAIGPHLALYLTGVLGGSALLFNELLVPNLELPGCLRSANYR